MSELVTRVVAHWRALPVDDDDPDAIGIVRAGVATSALDAFEHAHRIALPAAFRELWSLSDGTATMDRNEHMFWPLDNIDDNMRAFGEAGWPDDSRWATFADFRLGARTFILHFDRGRTSVCAIDATANGPFLDIVQPLADSFETFLEAYLSWTS